MTSKEEYLAKRQGKESKAVKDAKLRIKVSYHNKKKELLTKYFNNEIDADQFDEELKNILEDGER